MTNRDWNRVVIKSWAALKRQREARRVGKGRELVKIVRNASPGY